MISYTAENRLGGTSSGKYGVRYNADGSINEYWDKDSVDISPCRYFFEEDYEILDTDLISYGIEYTLN